jgi:hypothetical protein
MDYQLHKLCIKLKDYNEKNLEELIDFFKINPHVIHLIKSLGSWELEIELEENNINNIYNYTKELKDKFAKVIKQIELVTITKELKLDFFPESI